MSRTPSWIRGPLTLAGRATLAVFAMLPVAGCGGSSAAPPAAAQAAPPALPPGAVAVVHITPAMVSEVGVAPVGQRSTPGRLLATGRVQLDESRIARIVAPVAGRVTRLAATVGDTVRAGDPLFYLISRDAAAALQDRAASQHDLDMADKTLRMTQDLYDHEAASRIALEQAKSDAAKAQERVALAEHTLEAIGIHSDPSTGALDPQVPVTSPITGTVIERHLSDAQYVQPDPAPLLTIADLSTVWVEADVFERDVHLLREGQSAEVTTSAYPDHHFTAKVSRIGDVLDPATRTAKVRFLVANEGRRLKPEMFASVTLQLDDAETAIMVPAAAVMTEGDQTFVYVQVDPQTFARRAVEVTADTPESRRVLHGLAASDRVVVKGALLLRQHEDRVSD